MKTKQIVLGLMLFTLICFMGSNSAFVISEPITVLFLFGIVILIFLLLLFTYQVKNDLTKMQKSMDELVAELKHTREVQEELLISRQQDVRKEFNKATWDDLGQVEKDAHISKIIESMESPDLLLPQGSQREEYMTVS